MVEREGLPALGASSSMAPRPPDRFEVEMPKVAVAVSDRGGGGPVLLPPAAAEAAPWQVASSIEGEEDDEDVHRWPEVRMEGR
jgi:hypothetical protein